MKLRAGIIVTTLAIIFGALNVAQELVSIRRDSYWARYYVGAEAQHEAWMRFMEKTRPGLAHPQ